LLKKEYYKILIKDREKSEDICTKLKMIYKIVKEYVILIVLPIAHVADVGLDVLYIVETPMEDEEYYLMLIIFMIFPFFVVLVFSYISAY